LQKSSTSTINQNKGWFSWADVGQFALGTICPVCGVVNGLVQ